MKMILLAVYTIFFSYYATITAGFTREVRHHDNRTHWHGGNIHRFEVHDRAVWGGGRWHHGSYLGHFGWWWIVGPSWYYYPRPIYPYPDPYTPPQTTTIIIPPEQSWYYCESSKEYYPYVSSCPGGWKTVPATPQK